MVKYSPLPIKRSEFEISCVHEKKKIIEKEMNIENKREMYYITNYCLNCEEPRIWPYLFGSNESIPLFLPHSPCP